MNRKERQKKSKQFIFSNVWKKLLYFLFSLLFISPFSQSHKIDLNYQSTRVVSELIKNVWWRLSSADLEVALLTFTLRGRVRNCWNVQLLVVWLGAVCECCACVSVCVLMTLITFAPVPVHDFCREISTSNFAIITNYTVSVSYTHLTLPTIYSV